MATQSAAFAVTYLYPRKDMSRLDMDYYLKHHIPTTNSLWGPFGLTGCIVSDVDKDNDYALVVVTLWKDRASWDAAKGSDVSPRLVDDVKNFTDVASVLLPGMISN